MEESKHASLLSQYNIKPTEFLGKGGVGTVYSAKHPLVPTRDTAVKVKTVPLYKLDELIRDLLVLHEIAGMYPHLQSASPIFIHRNKSSRDFEVVIVTPKSSGDLRDLLASLHNWKGVQVLTLVWDIAYGLDILHSLDLTHNDLKPENILIDDKHAKIADYDLVLLDHPVFRRSVSQLITFYYRPPERLCATQKTQLQGAFGAAGDMW